MPHFDVGIVGLGAMGSMAALELTRRGRRVIGFDRFHPPHPFGSSHGRTRIIREAYFEHPQYVPLVQRAYQRWADLERESGEELLLTTGGLMAGAATGVLLQGARRSATEHRLPYQELSAAQVRERFPMFLAGENEIGLFEPRAGVLFPERCIALALRLAQAAGAELHFDEPAVSWTAGETLNLRTAAGHWRVDRLILAAGAWLPGLGGIPLPLEVTRQTLFWFAPVDGAALGPQVMPIFIWEWVPGRMFYGFPDLGEGVKLAIHHEGAGVEPGKVRRTVDPEEADELRAVALARLRGVTGAVVQSAVCLYTNTPDRDFILDRHPVDRRVIVASPCSGHGFKFAPAIAEVLGDLVEDRLPAFDLDPFRLTRFRR